MTHAIIVAAAVLYCWYPPDYGTKRPPACALTYEQCQKLVGGHGGSCKSE